VLRAIAELGAQDIWICLRARHLWRPVRAGGAAALLSSGGVNGRRAGAFADYPLCPLLLFLPLFTPVPACTAGMAWPATHLPCTGFFFSLLFFGGVEEELLPAVFTCPAGYSAPYSRHWCL